MYFCTGYSNDFLNLFRVDGEIIVWLFYTLCGDKIRDISFILETLN